MCGIAGILKVHDPKDGAPPHPLEAIPEARLDVLDESIRHRGPDGQGRFRDRVVRGDGVVVDVAFVHRRLSIIDHAGGHQPMVHDGERLRPDLTYQPGEAPRLVHELCPPGERPGLVAVVFNGCVYNHRALRTELEGLGHRFETDHSDTEVLVHAWRAWGKEHPLYLDGMFAILAWDRHAPGFIAARDRWGEKPLYASGSCLGSGTYVCTSSAAGITWLYRDAAAATGQEHDGVCPYTGGIDARDFGRWISHGAGTGPASWCDDEIEPGNTQALLLSDAGHEPVHADVDDAFFEIESISEGARARFGPFPMRTRTGPTPPDDAIDTMIQRAVASRLEADTDVGVLLSAGIDSGLIASHLRELGASARAITVRMPERAYDESDGARMTAEHLGIEHTLVDVDPDPAGDLVSLIRGLGLPFGDSSLLPAYWAFKAASEHAKVVLTGDGGDELFAGYERHLIPHKGRWARFAFGLIPSPLLDQRDPRSRSAKLARLGRAARDGGYDDLLRIFDTHHSLGLTTGRCWAPHRLLLPPNAGRYFPRWAPTDAALHDMDWYLGHDLLRKTDTASMAVPIEARAPFLARELVRAALAIPFDDLVRGGRKGLLKRVARRRLPDPIVDRPKQGFAIPVGEWFRTDYGGMRQLLHDQLGSDDPFGPLRESGIDIHMGYVRKMLREHDLAGERSVFPWRGRDHAQRLYLLLVLSVWCAWLRDVRANNRPEPEPGPA